MPEKRKRPGGESEALTSSLAGDNIDSTPNRCRMCGARIWSDEAIRTGLGAECRRALLAALASTDSFPASGGKGSRRRENLPPNIFRDVTKNSADPTADLIAGLRQAVDALEALLGGGDR